MFIFLLHTCGEHPASATWMQRPLTLPYQLPMPSARQTNRFIVLALTFLCYTAYHASRKPPSIVKSVLHGDAQANGEQPGMEALRRDAEPVCNSVSSSRNLARRLPGRLCVPVLV